METNPYAAPREMEPAAPPTEAEAVRRDHLKHEASVKGVGSIYLIGGIILLFAAFGAGIAGSATRSEGEAYILLVAGALGATGILGLAVASGLRRLKPWARITAMVLSGIGIFVSFFGLPISVIVLLIHAYIFVMLLSPKSTLVFSPYYKEIVAATPHIKYRTSIVVWIALGILLLILVLMFFGGPVGR